MTVPAVARDATQGLIGEPVGFCLEWVSGAPDDQSSGLSLAEREAGDGYGRPGCHVHRLRRLDLRTAGRVLRRQQGLRVPGHCDLLDVTPNSAPRPIAGLDFTRSLGVEHVVG
jgi:hypothetical protein